MVTSRPVADITLDGTPCHTSGDLPRVGDPAPPFRLVDGTLKDVTLAGFPGKVKILSILPSLDTSVCATSTRTFNEKVAGLAGVVVLVVSADLPFAQSRFCGAEGVDKVQSASTFRNGDFGDSYGVRLADGKLAGLMARAVVVVDDQGQVAHTQLVPDIGQEPDYDAALAVLK